MILRPTIGRVAILWSIYCIISRSQLAHMDELLQDITIKNHHSICEMVEVKTVRPSCQLEWCEMVHHLTPE